MNTFNDLIFKNHLGGINAHHVFDNDWEISVSAGEMAYSYPREDNLDSSAYLLFEVAIFNPNGDFTTSADLQVGDDGVVGLQSREDINNIIEKIKVQ